MTFSVAFFRQRLLERLTMENASPPQPCVAPRVLNGWDPERVSEFLRQQLDSTGHNMEKVVIIGAGGHAKVVIEILEESGQFELAGCTSKGGPEGVLGLPVLGDDSALPSLYARGVRHAFVALGDNRLRRELITKLKAGGFRLINAVSRRAAVSPRARLGESVAIMAGAVINADSEIDDGAIINTGATVDHDCRIGACAHIAPGVNLAGCVRVGEGTFMGAGSCAIPGVSIGSWTVVGAGAVVVRDLPAEVTAIGVPARTHPCSK